MSRSLDHCSEDMDLSARRTEILARNETVSKKAEALLLETAVYNLSKDECSELIVEIPDDVKKEIGRLKSPGTQLDLPASVSATCWGFNMTLAAIAYCEQAGDFHTRVCAVATFTSQVRHCCMLLA